MSFLFIKFVNKATQHAISRTRLATIFGNMNNLDYSISLRTKGFSKSEIKEKLFEKGLDEKQVEYYLKKSDEVFLNQTLANKRYHPEGKTKSSLKIVVLLVSLFLLSLVFFGYARIGLIWLFILWSIIGYSSYRK